MNLMNGLLLIDKSTGMTSHDVVSRVRRILGIRGIGHAGTLDPLASGLLVLLVGEATKVSDYLLNGDKSYELTVRLGVKTDSMDITGRVLSERACDASDAQIRQAIIDLQGVLDLKVPVHSAVKVQGRKLYEFAHKGLEPEHVPNRTMRFFDVEAISVDRDGENTRARVKLSCSKGSFVRAWADHLGELLRCGGCVETLRRVGSAPFKVHDALAIDDLEARWEGRQERSGRELGAAWVPLSDSLPHFKRIDIAGQDEYLLKNGQISSGLKARLLQFVVPDGHQPVRVISQETQDLLALLVAEPGEFYRIRRVFHRA